MFRDKTRFIVTLTALLVTGFLVTSLVSYTVAVGSISRQISDNALPLTSDNVYSEIQRDLMRPIFILLADGQRHLSCATG